MIFYSMAPTITTDGTISEGPATAGEKEMNKRYPAVEGLTAGDTKQTKVPYLEEQGLD